MIKQQISKNVCSQSINNSTNLKQTKNIMTNWDDFGPKDSKQESPQKNRVQAIWSLYTVVTSCKSLLV